MDQRAEPRISVAAEATIEVLSESAPSQVLSAEMVDLSSRGMRLIIRKPVPIDAALCIRVEKDQYLGEVAYCTTDGVRFYVGVSLFNVIRNVAEVTERMSSLVAPR